MSRRGRLDAAGDGSGSGSGSGGDVLPLLFLLLFLFMGSEGIRGWSCGGAVALTKCGAWVWRPPAPIRQFASRCVSHC